MRDMTPDKTAVVRMHKMAQAGLALVALVQLGEGSCVLRAG